MEFPRPLLGKCKFIPFSGGDCAFCVKFRVIGMRRMGSGSRPHIFGGFIVKYNCFALGNCKCVWRISVFSIAYGSLGICRLLFVLIVLDFWSWLESFCLLALGKVPNSSADEENQDGADKNRFAHNKAKLGLLIGRFGRCLARDYNVGFFAELSDKRVDYLPNFLLTQEVFNLRFCFFERWNLRVLRLCLVVRFLNFLL